jgi:hypothetical protein
LGKEAFGCLACFVLALRFRVFLCEYFGILFAFRSRSGCGYCFTRDSTFSLSAFGHVLDHSLEEGGSDTITGVTCIDMDAELGLGVRDLEYGGGCETVLDIADGQLLLVSPALCEADALFVSFEDLAEGCGEVSGAMDVVPVEGNETQEVHDLLVCFRVLEVKNCCDFLWVRGAPARSDYVTQHAQAVVVEMALAEGEDHARLPRAVKEIAMVREMVTDAIVVHEEVVLIMTDPFGEISEVRGYYPREHDCSVLAALRNDIPF